MKNVSTCLINSCQCVCVCVCVCVNKTSIKINSNADYVNSVSSRFFQIIISIYTFEAGLVCK
jgi:hypothetical protein